MSELIRSFIVVFSLFSFTLWIVGKNLPSYISQKEFRQWKILILSITSAAFLSPNIWIFFIVIITLFTFFPRDNNSRIIFYLLLICTVPLLSVDIPGFAGIRYIFEINYNRFLIIVLLLLPFLERKISPRLFSLPSDKYILAFIALVVAANFRDNTITNALRESLLIIIDIFIPYIILSRQINNLEQLNRVFFALFTALIPIAIIGIFETVKGWHLYDALSFSLSGKGTGYDTRAELLRAGAIFKSPIVLGYSMVIGFGLLLYLKPLVKTKFSSNLAGLVFFTSLIATLARGPWVGFVMLIMAYIWVGKAAVKWLTFWGLSILASIPLLSLTETGNKFLQLLPFVGTIRSDTIDYREQLLDMAWIVFQRQPWFGSPLYTETPEMETMRQGQGIIDVVNTYIQIVLSYGTIGLILFIMIFLGLLYKCYQMIQLLPKEQTDLIRMGRSLFAILVAIVVIIFTVSSIDYTPIFYWVFVGVTAAYLNICTHVIKSLKT
jgi:O-antigen ligase